jgi:hypothetical protein
MVIALGACDWIPFAFFNSIPIRGDPTRNPEVRVYLGIDGLSYHTVQDAIARGAFSGTSWKLAKSVAPFPVTSDANWTKILRTPALDGYELEYFDPIADKIQHPGLLGLARHVMPVVSESLNLSAPCQSAFDYRANGYFHGFSAYSDVFSSLGESLDNLFFTLEGRSETASVFTAYLLEFDVLGHMQKRVDVADALVMLSKKIDRFIQRHPERKFYFTLFSDHGMDFMPAPVENLVVMEDELPKVGVTSVRSLAGRDPSQGPYAVPLMHTRVSYISLHTHAALVSEVSIRASQIPSVDVVVGKLDAPVVDPGAPRPLEWFGLWSGGSLALYFGYDQQTDEYYLPSGYDYSRFGISLSFSGGEVFRVIEDEALFSLVKETRYPDLFYRVRSGLSAHGVRFPGQVLVSFKANYVSKGFSLPGSDKIANEGFHGSLSEFGTLGTLLTNERELPSVVRAESLLDFFPRLKTHLSSSRKIAIQDFDSKLSLNYQ